MRSVDGSERPGTTGTARGRLATVLRRLAACALLLALVPIGAAMYVEHRLSSNMAHLHGVFDPLTNRPARPGGGEADAVNVVVLTRDMSRVTGPAWGAAVMLLHLDADRGEAWVVAIPSATQVAVPGLGPRAIGPTATLEDPSLVVGAVEELSGVHVDHLALLDWATVGDLVDASGGIDVDVRGAVSSVTTNDGWVTGLHHLGGVDTVDYVLGRAGDRVPTLERLARQQAVLRTLGQVALHQEMRKDPEMLFKFLDTMTRGLSVDADWSVWDMTRLGISLRGFRSAHLGFVTMPVAGGGRTGAGAVLRAAPAARGLWRAVTTDDVAAWAARHNRWLQSS